MGSQHHLGKVVFGLKINSIPLLDMRFSQQCLWKVLSSDMRCPVVQTKSCAPMSRGVKEARITHGREGNAYRIFVEESKDEKSSGRSRPRQDIVETDVTFFFSMVMCICVLYKMENATNT
jgi:hypothetical protein